ncbi:MAG TPA: DUF4256 domain-containing protein [Flavisolibacter sp.]
MTENTKIVTGKIKKALSAEQEQSLLLTVKARFEKNMARHPGIAWAEVQKRLETHPGGLWSLQEMEKTGGEPDVTGQEAETGQYIFFDCAAESPAGRRSACYDREAHEARKENKPQNNAVDMAREMGITLLSEEEYAFLQTLGNFDLKTSSWLKTPDAVRKLGGALFGDKRYGRTFIYHNGAQSYYASRGFRGSLKV